MTHEAAGDELGHAALGEPGREGAPEVVRAHGADLGAYAGSSEVPTDIEPEREERFVLVGFGEAPFDDGDQVSRDREPSIRSARLLASHVDACVLELDVGGEDLLELRGTKAEPAVRGEVVLAVGVELGTERCVFLAREETLARHVRRAEVVREELLRVAGEEVVPCGVGEDGSKEMELLSRARGRAFVFANVEVVLDVPDGEGVHVAIGAEDSLKRLRLLEVVAESLVGAALALAGREVVAQGVFERADGLPLGEGEVFFDDASRSNFRQRTKRLSGAASDALVSVVLEGAPPRRAPEVQLEGPSFARHKSPPPSTY